MDKWWCWPGTLECAVAVVSATAIGHAAWPEGNLKHVLSKEMLGLFGVAKLPVGHAMSLGIGSSGKVVMGTCGLMGNDADVGVCFSGKP